MLHASLRSLPILESPADVVRALRTLVRARDLDLPLPAATYEGTRARFEAFAELGATDLSLARLAEGHADALAILAEAGARASSNEHLYGVWAAEPPDARVVAERTAEGWTLRGRKRFASGAHGLDHALVTATVAGEDGGRLFDLDLRARGVSIVDGTWNAVGMAATESLDVHLDNVAVAESAAVGRPGFYLSRPGFWQGAVGVAACWYGGALGMFRMVTAQMARLGDRDRASDHQLAHLGAMAATSASMEGALDRAAREMADDPADTQHRGERRALVTRQLVEQGCQEILLRSGRASGTSPLVFDRAHAKRAADLPVYLRQHHAEKDSAALGRLVLAEVRS